MSYIVIKGLTRLRKNAHLLLFILTAGVFAVASAHPEAENAHKLFARINSIHPYMQELMRNNTWHDDCPVALHQLSQITIPYWGMDGKSHQGTLIVHSQLASEIKEIFVEIYSAKFPIEHMELIDSLDHKKRKKIESHNTIAFNCRKMVGAGWLFSQHSYGWAIDINPHLNPYVKGQTVAPINNPRFLQRDKKQPGMIHRGDVVYQAFIRRGWRWGGDWLALKDYMHFEKPLIKPVYER